MQHGNIGSRGAEAGGQGVEGLVAPLQDVQVGVGEEGEVFHVQVPVCVSQSARHVWPPVRAELAVEHEHLG